MFVHLLGLKAVYHLTDKDMAEIVGISRTAYTQKVRSGRFTAEECMKFCEYFQKPFDYLFATEPNKKGA